MNLSYVFILALLICVAAAAQESEVRTSLSTNGNIWVGQKVTLVVELLAPGFFSSAATFDLPDPPRLLIMSSAAHPVVGSKVRNGVNYTVQRHELSVFAEGPGEQAVPSLAVRFSYKKSPLDQNEIPVSLKTAPMRFTAVMPPGAERLGNIITARDLKIEETWKPLPGKEAAKPGDAFTRTIMFSAPGTPAMLFPPFPAGKVNGLGIYDKSSVLDGDIRRDTITYICQQSGQFTIPAAQLTWWDIRTRQLRTHDFPARTLEGAAPSASAASKFEWWKPAGTALIAALATAAAWKWRGWVAVFRPVHLEPLNPHPVVEQGSRS